MNDNRDHLRALHAAYVEASGIPVSLSHSRLATLREFDRRNLTPEDVRAVVKGVKAHIERGTKGYTDASLDWRNAMGAVDTFEERALKIRQARQRRKGNKPRPIVAQTTTIGQGDTVTHLAPAPVDLNVPQLDVRKALRDIADKLGQEP